MYPESPLVEQHRAAGAELATYFGVPLPARFSEFAAAYRLARERVALVDTNFRAVFSLTGPDRVRYLNAVLTSNVRDLTSGEGTIGLLLNAQAHILAEVETLALDDRLILLGHRLAQARTAETLDKFIIMDDATLSDETARSGTLAIEGPRAPELARELSGVEIEKLGAHGHTAATIHAAGKEISCCMIHHSLYGFPGAEFLVRSDELAAVWAALAAAVAAQGGGPVGYRAVNALRLEAGVPWFGVDFDEHQIPHEAALENSHISYTKGCYTGQEIVERVRSRGHVNRRLSGLQFATVHPPLPGTALLAGGNEVGKVTSAAFSPLRDRAIGLGYLRAEQAQPGNVVQCGGTSAEVVPLPLREAARAAQQSKPPAAHCS
jgi:folate-binding protein YgfZ